MQRIFQALIVVALLALTPALAQSRPATLPTQAAVVLPVGVELSDEELKQVEGRWVFLLGIASSVGAGFLERSISGEETTWGDVARDAAVGFASGVAGKVVGSVAKAAGNNLAFVRRNDGSTAAGVASTLAGGATSGYINRNNR